MPTRVTEIPKIFLNVICSLKKIKLSINSEIKLIDAKTGYALETSKYFKAYAKHKTLSA